MAEKYDKGLVFSPSFIINSAHSMGEDMPKAPTLRRTDDRPLYTNEAHAALACQECGRIGECSCGHGSLTSLSKSIDDEIKLRIQQRH